MEKLFNYGQFITERYTTNFEFNNMIDYTLLDDNASDEDIIELCEKAKRFGVKSVCVMPKHVKLSDETLRGSNILVCTVISFPEGTNSTEEKVNETRKAISNGADEIDMVINWRELKKLYSGDKPLLEPKEHMGFYDSMKDEIIKVKESTQGKLLKVIVESGNLTEDETGFITEVCIKAGSDFIKTSTGKVKIGAETSKVAVMREGIDYQKSDMQIKASGGVRTLDDILKYKKLGVTRFGMGHGAVDILNGVESDNKGY